MERETVLKTVRQYSARPIPEEEMARLLEIAGDFRKVKSYVYARYGGIGGLSLLYPGNAVQNEMTASGLRQQLGLPSVYFHLAVREALSDIRSRWTATKQAVRERADKNENFTDQERHYLRFVLRFDSVLGAVLRFRVPELAGEPGKALSELEGCVDACRLQVYLRRQVRKFHARPSPGRETGFSASERAFRYGDHGIYLTTKESRRRLFIPLTDNNRYERQVRILPFQEEGRVEIRALVERAVRVKKGYGGRVGIALGIQVLLTTHRGSRYGEEAGVYHFACADYIREQARVRGKNRSLEGRPGREKYKRKKRRLEERLHSYINRELNRFLETEQPGEVYLARPGAPQAGKWGKRENNRTALWQRGYIRRRLIEKCRERGIEVVEVPGGGLRGRCSRCGGEGMEEKGQFYCPACGHREDAKANRAGNALGRGTAPGAGRETE